MIQSAEAAMPSTVPRNIEAEKSVLGSICLSCDAHDEVAEVIRSEHFYSESNRLIFEAIEAITKRGERPDAVTLSEELTRSRKLEIVGGDKYLIQVLEAVPNAAHARYYADIVIDRWTARRISEISGQAHSAVVHGTETTDEILAEASGEFHHLMESTVQSGPVNMSDALESLDARWASGSDRGLMTGFPVLDELLGGLRPGSVYVPAARPGAGKTALALCIAHNVASQGLGALIFSLEMGKNDVTQRLLALESGLPFKQLSKVDQLDEMERDRLAVC
jgi:replicative DNA helicase